MYAERNFLLTQRTNGAWEEVWRYESIRDAEWNEME